MKKCEKTKLAESERIKERVLRFKPMIDINVVAAELDCSPSLVKKVLSGIRTDRKGIFEAADKQVEKILSEVAA